MKWYLKVLKHYADFKGRAIRKEYWMFLFLNIIFLITSILLDIILGLPLIGPGFGPLFILYFLALLIPTLAVTVRRLHDIGRDGRLILIGLIPIVGTIWLLVFLFLKSEPNENEYGLSSKNIVGSLSTLEQFIFVYIILAFTSSVFYSMIPKINYNFFLSIYDVTRTSLYLILAIIPLALVLNIRSKPLKIITLIPGIAMFLYPIYEIAIQLIN